MGMRSEIAVEIALKPILEAIEVELKRKYAEDSTKAALKRVAYVLANQFEWSVPSWADEFFKKLQPA